MTDPIKAALDEAAKRLCFGHNGEDCDMCVAPEHCYKAHRAAIAAFLRALPPGWHMDKSRDDLAAAVEEAARDA